MHEQTSIPDWKDCHTKCDVFLAAFEKAYTASSISCTDWILQAQLDAAWDRAMMVHENVRHAERVFDGKAKSEQLEGFSAKEASLGHGDSDFGPGSK